MPVGAPPGSYPPLTERRSRGGSRGSHAFGVCLKVQTVPCCETDRFVLLNPRTLRSHINAVLRFQIPDFTVRVRIWACIGPVSATHTPPLNPHIPIARATDTAPILPVIATLTRYSKRGHQGFRGSPASVSHPLHTRRGAHGPSGGHRRNEGYGSYPAETVREWPSGASLGLLGASPTPDSESVRGLALSVSVTYRGSRGGLWVNWGSVCTFSRMSPVCLCGSVTSYRARGGL